jgi:uncharacterized protein
MKVHALRLKPEQELRQAIEEFVKENNIKAGCIVTGIGSLNHVRLRLADLKVESFYGNFEIVSFTGTLSQDKVHLHLSIADRLGRVVGGHLKIGIVQTTVELVIGELKEYEFKRLYDEQTGFEELMVFKNEH